jgi:aspartate/methionine/tyrosine aminotransferase
MITPSEMPPQFSLSKRVRSIPEALSIYLNQIVYDLKRRGRDVITLSLGEAFFDIPLMDFKKLDVEKCFHYSDSQGIPGLRQKIADYYKKHYDAPVNPDTELLISAGSKPLLFMVMQCVVEPGEEILIHEPAWLSYQEQARLIDAKPTFISYDAKPSEFHKYITEKTRLLIINNPNNPAGLIYSEKDLKLIYDLCHPKGIYLLVDEAYSDFIVDQPFYSATRISSDKSGLIVINSLSKNMGISGWRVGYSITHPTLTQELLKVNQHLITCAPSILLYYLDYYFEEIINITLPQVEQVVVRRSRVAKMITQLGLTALPGSATFYFFISLKGFSGSSMDFALHMLLNNNVAVVPGSAYGESTKNFIRVAIGSESEERIWQALAMIRDLIERKTVDTEQIQEKLARLNFAPYQFQDEI